MTAAANNDGDDVVAVARGWLGTPYRHQASCRGAGADCLGLVRGVWRELIGAEPEAVPAYTSDWSEPSRTEDLLAAAARNFVPMERGEATQGDIVVMRMRDGAVAKHVGILARSPAGYETIVHSYSGQGVVESPLTPAWSRRIAAVFRFPPRSS